MKLQPVVVERGSRGYHKCAPEHKMDGGGVGGEGRGVGGYPDHAMGKRDHEERDSQCAKHHGELVTQYSMHHHDGLQHLFLLVLVAALFSSHGYL